MSLFSYFEHSKQVNKRWLLFTVQVKKDVTPEDIEETETVQVYQDGTLLKEWKFNYPVYAYAKEVIQEMKGRSGPLNLFVFGLAGSGKTSFINNIATLLFHKGEVKKIGSEGGENEHCTKNFTKYSFGKTIYFQDDFDFKIFDCWGVDANNYKDMDLSKILNGVMPVGWDMSMSYDNISEEDMKKLQETKGRRTIHYVIFVIRASANDEQLKDIQKHFSSISDLCPNPLVVITHGDELNKKLLSNPNDDFEQEILDIRKKVSEKLNIGTNRIFFNVNYFQDGKKIFQYDKNTFRILYHSLKSAQIQEARGVQKIEFD